MAAIEVVSDQRKKTAMSMDEMKKLHQNTYEAGAMVRLGLNNILMSPPLVISEAEVDQILNALDYGFASM
jgi:adenosylmethionine-8-amino-7-oxononanoate aminotransferase